MESVEIPPSASERHAQHRVSILSATSKLSAQSAGRNGSQDDIESSVESDRPYIAHTETAESRRSTFAITRNDSDLLPTSLRFEGPGRWVHALSHATDEDHEDFALSQSGEDARPKRWRLWLLVLVASIISAFITFWCSAFGSFLQSAVSVPKQSEKFSDFVIRAFWQVFLCVAAYVFCIVFSCFGQRQIAQYMGGSGIPELKCELGGVHLTGLFNWRIICGKLLGLSLMSGAGLPTGFEGPFVHASCCVGHFLMCKISVFKPLLYVRHLRHMAMITMVAVGVSCTFATPLGGVLFALEVTDSFASTAYLHCYFGATLAGIVSTFLRRCVFQEGSWWYYKLLFSNDLKPVQMTVVQEFTFFILYSILGLVCGILGALFVRLHRFFFKSIARIVGMYKGDKRIMFILVVACAGATHTVLTWANPFFRQYNSNGQAIGVLTGNAPIKEWGSHPFLTISYSIVTRFIISALVLALPLPNGSVAPTFVLGALLGRGFGNICWYYLIRDDFFFTGNTDHEDLKNEFVSRFALVGASAFVAGSMRSFAQVVIVFERVAMPNMLIPLCASSLVALFAGNAISQNFFDSMIQLKRLPHLPSLAQGRSALTVADLLSTDVPVITSPLTRDKIVAVRKRYPNWQHEVPIVLALAQEGAKTFHVDHQDSEPTALERLVVISALRSFPSSLLQADPSNDIVTPLHVSSDTTLKSLLPLLTSLDKTVAFVTKDGFLVGAVSLTDLYSRAVRG